MGANRSKFYNPALVDKKKRNKTTFPKLSAHQLEADELKERIYLEYMKQGGYSGPLTMTDIVMKHRPGISRNTAATYGWRILNNPDIKRKIIEKNSKRREKQIMKFEERLQYLTDVIMQEIEPDAETKDRLKAVDMMNRMEGVYVNNNVNVNYSNNLSIEQERDIVQRRLNQLLGKTIEGEVVKEEVVPEEKVDE